MSIFIYFLVSCFIMLKNGQTTIYVALGLIVIILIGGLLYLMFRQSENKGVISNLGQQSEEVKTLIKNCFENNLLQALYLAGVQGGYIKTNEKSIVINDELSVGYGYFEGEDILANNEQFINEVSDYLNFAVEKCADFSKFTNFKVEKKSEIKSRIEIFDDKVNARLSYPVSVSKNNEVVTYEDLYTTSHNIRLGKILKTAKGIIQSEVRNPDYIDVVYLSNSELDIKIYDIDATKNLYVITDDQSVVNGVKYVFQFANKF